MKSLTALREWNLAHRNAGALKYGQSQLDISDEMDLDADRARYEAYRAKDLLLSGAHGIDAIMRAERLDAILFPAQTGAPISARPGYPTVIVPFGLFVPQPPVGGGPGGGGPGGGGAPNPYPEGYALAPAPYGVSFTGMACSEPRLIELAYAFEHATKKRVPPAIAP